MLNLDLPSYLDRCCYPAIDAAGEGATLASLSEAGEELVLDPAAVAAKLAEHTAAIAAVEEDLPRRRVNLGLFSVDAQPVKVAVLKVHAEVVEGLYGRLRGAIEALTHDSAKAYAGIMARLLHEPANVEEVAELEQLVADLPQKLAAFDSDTRWELRENREGGWGGGGQK